MVKFLFSFGINVLLLRLSIATSTVSCWDCIAELFDTEDNEEEEYINNISWVKNYHTKSSIGRHCIWNDEESNKIDTIPSVRTLSICKDKCVESKRCTHYQVDDSGTCSLMTGFVEETDAKRVRPSLTKSREPKSVCGYIKRNDQMRPKLQTQVANWCISSTMIPILNNNMDKALKAARITEKAFQKQQSLSTVISNDLLPDGQLPIDVSFSIYNLGGISNLKVRTIAFKQAPENPMEKSRILLQIEPLDVTVDFQVSLKLAEQEVFPTTSGSITMNGINLGKSTFARVKLAKSRHNSKTITEEESGSICKPIVKGMVEKVYFRREEFSLDVGSIKVSLDSLSKSENKKLNGVIANLKEKFQDIVFEVIRNAANSALHTTLTLN